MKILHTSDWHLGRKFVNEDLLATQSDFVDWLVETVRTEKIELVAIAMRRGGNDRDHPEHHQSMALACVGAGCRS